MDRANVSGDFRLRTGRGRFGILCVVTAMALCLISSPITAEIYPWTDASGKMHFTQDLGQVPPEFREVAKLRGKAPVGRGRIQHIDAAKAPARLAPRHAGVRLHQAAGKKVHRIRVERAGASMRVMARINGSVDVPFVIDTGATDVVIPMYAAKELGLAVEGPGVRTSPRSTANGLIDAPVVMLDSVQLGSAVVHGVGGIALKNMRYGLLGLSFFNQFNYNIDAQTGIITLTENDLAERGILRAGRSHNQWSGEFASAHREIEWAEEKLEQVPFGHSRERKRAQDGVAKWKNRLSILENEADDARVPFRWRD